MEMNRVKGQNIKMLLKDGKKILLFEDVGI